jgi:hypothetical protein
VSAPGADPLFRDQAVRWASGSRPGDAVRLDAPRTRALFRLLLLLVTVAALAGALVQVPVTASGDAVLDRPQSSLIGRLPPGTDVRVGDRLVVTAEPRVRLRAVVTAVEREDDALMVNATVPSGSMPVVAARIRISTGTSSLIAALVDAFVGGTA